MRFIFGRGILRFRCGAERKRAVFPCPARAGDLRGARVHRQRAGLRPDRDQGLGAAAIRQRLDLSAQRLEIRAGARRHGECLGGDLRLPSDAGDRQCGGGAGDLSEAAAGQKSCGSSGGLIFHDTRDTRSVRRITHSMCDAGAIRRGPPAITCFRARSRRDGGV